MTHRQARRDGAPDPPAGEGDSSVRVCQREPVGCRRGRAAADWLGQAPPSCARRL